MPTAPERSALKRDRNRQTRKFDRIGIYTIIELRIEGEE